MKRLLSILLAAVMLLSLLTACGSTPASTAEEASSAAQVSAPAEAPAVEEAPAQEAPAEGVPEEVPEEPSVVEEPEPEIPEMVLPLTEETVTFTFFLEACDQYQEFLTAWGDNVAYLKAEELTNVHIDFQEQPVQSYSEKFNLMIASGDYTDLLKKVDSMYAGGIASAVSEEVVIDVSEYINTAMPNYLAALEVDSTAYLGAFNEDGSAYQIISVLSDVVNTMGLFVRQDWLDELDLAVPETYDELYDVLSAFKSSYGCNYPYFLGASMQDLYLSGGFGTIGFSLTDNKAASHFYHDGDTIKSALIEDSFKEYLQYLNKLYSEGLISADFYTIQLSPPQMQSIYYGGDAGIFSQNVRDISDVTIDLTPMRDLVKNKGEVSGFAAAADYSAGGEPISITSNCADPELACKYLDFWFSEQGTELSNYGILDESFVYDEDGTVQYTDLVLNNPDGMPYRISSVFYKCQNFVRFNVVDIDFVSYNEDQMAALEVFSTCSEDKHQLPELVRLDEEESAVDQKYLTDVETYAQEMTLGFVTGSVSFDQWDEYVANLKSLGIDECIAAHQSAYDKYLARVDALG